MAVSRRAAPRLAEDVPWRALPAGAPALVPKIHLNPLLRLRPSAYALAVMKRRDPIGEGFASEAHLESAGPECLVPGLVKPVRVLGLKIWPINLDLRFLEPVGRQLRSIGKFLDSAVTLMNASFQES